MKRAQYALFWAALACLIAMIWLPQNIWQLAGTAVLLVIGALVCAVARTERKR